MGLGKRGGFRSGPPSKGMGRKIHRRFFNPRVKPGILQQRTFQGRLVLFQGIELHRWCLQDGILGRVTGCAGASGKSRWRRRGAAAGAARCRRPRQVVRPGQIEQRGARGIEQRQSVAAIAWLTGEIARQGIPGTLTSSSPPDASRASTGQGFRRHELEKAPRPRRPILEEKAGSARGLRGWLPGWA